MNKLKTLVPWMKQKNLIQPIIRAGNNSHFFDYNNRKIVDFTSGLMVVNLGHNNKYIYKGFDEHIKTGLAYVPSTFGTYHRDKLSERLIDVSSFKDGKVFYSNGGADANETAMFISLEVNSYLNRYNKKRILSFEKSYHGGSSIITSLISGDDRSKQKGLYYNSNSLGLEPIIPNPTLKDNGTYSLRQIENEFKRGKVCAILLEGSSGSAGIYLYPENYLKKVRKLCDDYNVVLICDEVMSGFGRTGSFFAHQKSGQDILPDMITCAKGLTSGYAQLGAVIISDNISRHFDNSPVYQGLTYSGHPMACSVANRCMDLYLKNKMEIINKAEYKGKIMFNLGDSFKNNNPLIKDYRNNGLLGGFELDTNLETMDKIKNDIYNEGIYCYSRNQFIFTAPPLVIEQELLIETMHKINNIIKKYVKE